MLPLQTKILLQVPFEGTAKDSFYVPIQYLNLEFNSLSHAQLETTRAVPLIINNYYLFLPNCYCVCVHSGNHTALLLLLNVK